LFFRRLLRYARNDIEKNIELPRALARGNSFIEMNNLRSSKFITASCLLLLASCLLLSVPVSAQEPGPAPTPAESSAMSESLRLPEVVITGIDRSKIQRLIPKVAPPSSLPVVTESSRDLSEALVQEGNRLSLSQARQAEERYTKAIERDPTNSTAYLRLGDVERAQGKYPEAAEAYQKALAISAGLLEAHYQLGILYESRLSNLQQAKEHYQKYLQLGGADHRVQIWLRDIEQQ